MAALQAKQTIQQRLMLAPNVTLALEVLRMTTMELQTFLERQLEENPLLEIEEPNDEELHPSLAEPPSVQESPTASLDEDWLSHWNTVGERESEENNSAHEDRITEQQMINPQSLHESIRLQLGCSKLSAEERRLGEFLVHHLNEYGYLEGSLEELAAQAGATLEQITAALKIIQRFDPPGVGARDLRECLMIQLEYADFCDDGRRSQTHSDRTPGSSTKPLASGPVVRLNNGGIRDGHRDAAEKVDGRIDHPALNSARTPDAHQTSLAYRILRDHFELFVQHRLGAITRATGASPEEVAAAYECLKALNPKPGRIFVGELPPSIVPDLVVHHREKHYDVELNDQNVPHIKVSRAYYRMLRDPHTPSDAKEFLTNKLHKARWLIKAIDERNTTLLSIARCLISLQRDFLEHGPRAIKPLTQAQVASLIGRHPSTVSRAIAGKTIDTPYGISYLEQLFASGVPQSTSEKSISDEEIKSEIRRLITQEDSHHPLSDAAIAKQLAQGDIKVARRTIAKYRTALKLLPAHLRRRR